MYFFSKFNCVFSSSCSNSAPAPLRSLSTICVNFIDPWYCYVTVCAGGTTNIGSQPRSAKSHGPAATSIICTIQASHDFTVWPKSSGVYIFQIRWLKPEQTLHRLRRDCERWVHGRCERSPYADNVGSEAHAAPSHSAHV